MRPWFILTATLFSSAANAAPLKRVVVEHDSPARPLLRGRTLARYPSFDLIEVDQSQLEALPGRMADQVTVRDDLFDVRLAAGTIDSRDGSERLAGDGLAILQFVGPIKEEWLDAVRASGAKTVHAFPVNAYLVWAPSASIAGLEELQEQGIVQFVGAHHAQYKIDPDLAASTSKGPILITVQRYRAPGNSTRELIARLEVVRSWWPVLAYENARARATLDQIAELAQQPDVVWIGEHKERELFDEVQGQIVAGALAADQRGPSAPGYHAWLLSLGFSATPSDYPIVDVTDDGIGGGAAPTQPSNPLTGDATIDPRVIFRNSCNAAFPNDGRSPDGHGHINASIVGGIDLRTGSPFQDADGFNRGLGINPYTRIGGTRIFGGAYDISLCGNTDAGVIASSYSAGARISSNSWGCSGCAGSYDDSSQAYDIGTRDALAAVAGNQEMLFIFAAGNSGPGASTVGSPGNGKNMLTVGASENDRPTWTDGCAIGSAGADNAMDIIGFSSRGPAPGNRRKPEIIAPGTHIQGTASTHPQYNGGGVCDQFQPIGQTVFAASSGTSHSTPAVAGAASLVYWWLENAHAIASPSPALVKAYLTSHVRYLTGVSANDTLPSNNQGYGMPDLAVAFDGTARTMIDQSIRFDNSGEVHTIDAGISDPTRPVRVMLVWTDAPGALGTSPQVNNLDLQVIAGGVTYRGNVFSGRWSASGGAADTLNNYEAVFLPAGAAGAIQIPVTATGVSGDGVPNTGDGTDQDFALVAYNVAQNATFTLSAAPANASVCAPANGVYTIDVGSVLGFDEPVALSATGHPAGTTATFSADPVSPLPGSSILTISNTSAAPPGSYAVRIDGTATPSGINQSATVGLRIDDFTPSVSLTSPADGAAGVAVPVSFSWGAAGDAYDIEIASDSAFANVVESASGLTGASYSSTLLTTSSQYWWHVRARNACGTGAWSAAFSFTTAAAPGDCPLGTAAVVLLAESFETGAPGWTHSGTGDTWASSGARFHDGSLSFRANGSGTVSDQRLVSPAISLSAGLTDHVLRFWNHQTIERSSSGCYDGAIVEISTNDGATWTQLGNPVLLTDPYDGAVATGFSNPLAGLNAWCGDPQAWTFSVVDVAAYAGQTVRFRFRIGTDNIVAREGWYVDQLSVQGCQGAPPPPPPPPPPPAASHAGDLDGSGVSAGGNRWRANVDIAVHDAAHALVSGATVTGGWSGGASGSSSCTTNATGRCTVQSQRIQRTRTTATFTITNVSASGLSYQPGGNHDPDGDSNGTAITVVRP